EVNLDPGYFPQPGDTVEVVAASAVSGTFAAVESCVGITVTYTPSTAMVTFDGVVPGDLDGDGTVGGADLGLLLAAWGSCGDGCCPADLDGDGAVGGADLGLLLGYWF
ncbi:MAG: hypothetical protein H6816_15965, partial [Phycisphaerales bacterium]|nr:hypothetical protein [Phycisphaerales bacterium]